MTFSVAIPILVALLGSNPHPPVPASELVNQPNPNHCISLDQQDGAYALTNGCARRVYLDYCWDSEKSSCRCKSGRPDCATSIRGGGRTSIVSPGRDGTRIHWWARYD